MVASALTALSQPRRSHVRERSGLCVSRGVALLAFAGGVIHAAVIRHHVADLAVATAFAAMAAAQWWFAWRMLRNPTDRVRLLGVWLHGAILGTWLVSRTVGLAVVPGAEDPAPVGVSDATATVFSILVVVALARARSSGWRERRPVMPRRLAACIAGIVTVGVLLATVPAVLADHDHAAHEHPGSDTPDSQDDHDPVDDHHDDGHDHG